MALAHGDHAPSAGAAASEVSASNERVAWLCRRVAGGPVLEIGDGAIALLLGRTGIAATAVDAAADAIERRRTHLANEDAAVRERVALMHVQAATLPFEDGRFAAAILDDRLAHLLEPEHTLAEMRRVVRPDGLLLVSVRLGASTHRDHIDSMGVRRLAGALAPFCQPVEVALADGWLVVAARPGASDADRLALTLLDAADAQLRELGTTAIEARAEAAAARAEATRWRKRAERDAARVEKLRRAYERQRRHWSWRVAKALREARRSPRAFFGLPVRLVRIIRARRR